MLPRIRVIAVLVGMIVAAASLSGGDKPRPSIGGKVIGLKGKPEEGVEVRAKRMDTKMPIIIATTDRKGEYAFANLPVGQYYLTAYLDGAPLSQALITTQAKGWIKVNFDLQRDPVDRPGDRIETYIRAWQVANQFHD